MNDNMNTEQFTAAQAAAIQENRAEILVSASAGSGKTTVMIQRILRLLSEGADLNSMIICTFTKSAAADMRAKLAKRLNERADGGELWAKEAVEKLPLAEISTIDAFCARLARNYFYCADGIDPAFETLDEAAADALLSRSADEVLSEFAESGDPAFAELYEIFTPDRNEKKFKGIIIKLYEFAAIHPDPGAWLTDASRQAFGHARHLAALEEYYETLRPALLARIAALKRRCGGAGFVSCADSLETFYGEAAQNAEALARLSGVKPANETEEALYERYKQLRAEYKAFCKERGDALSSADPSPTARHIGVLTDVVRRMTERYQAKKQKKAQCDFNDVEHMALTVCNQIANETNNEKRITNNVGLNQITNNKLPHSSLLTPNSPPSALHPPPLPYQWLFVDEYQDINPLQDAIFARLAVKRFYVGDVKQSIYGFRLSEPKIFAAYERACIAGGTDGAKLAIRLNANFRSDSGILRFCDAVFSNAMTQAFGGAAYADSARFEAGRGRLFEPSVVCNLVEVDDETNNEKRITNNVGLNQMTNYKLQITNADGDCAAGREPGSAAVLPPHVASGDGAKPPPYGTESPSLPIHYSLFTIHSPAPHSSLLTPNSPPSAIHPPPPYSVKNHRYAEEEPDAAGAEADWVVEHILSLKKRKINEGGGERDVSFGDIAVLLRSTGKFADALCEKLRRAGIPVAVRKSAGDRESPAVAGLINYLRLVDNRRDDIALASVLKSAFGGFCSDAALAAVRLYADGLEDGERLPFFTAAERYAQAKADPTAQTLSALFSNLSRYEKLARVTAFSALAGRICAEYDYFKYVFALPDGRRAADGLSAFLDGLSVLPEGMDFSSALAAVLSGAIRPVFCGAPGAVQLMTVHAAKGLEFPFVILPNLAKGFNLDDLKQDCILDASLGAALKRFDAESRTTHKTSLWRLARLNARKKLLEEELRILYVALTRAKYQLALFACVKNGYEPKEGENAVSALDWLYPAMEPLASRRAPAACAAPAAVKPGIIFSEPAREFTDLIRAYTDFVYPYAQEPVKVTVTRASEGSGDNETKNEKRKTNNDGLNQITNYKLQITNADDDCAVGRGLGSDVVLLPHIVSGDGAKPPPYAAETPSLPIHYSLFTIHSSTPHSSLLTPNSPPSARRPLSLQTQTGDAYHKLLETADFTAPFQESFARFTESYPAMARLVRHKTAETALQKIAAHIGTRKYYRELPFLFRQENGVLLQGVIDLLIENGDGGLEIVDYKTGALDEGLFETYRRQVNLYAMAAERILSKKAVRKSIFALSKGEFIVFV